MRFTWQIHTIFFAYKHSSIFLFMSMSFHCDSSSHSSDPLFYLTKQVRGQQIHSNKALNAVLLFHVRQGDKKPSQCWGDENFPLTDPGMTIWAVWDCKDNNWAGTSVEKSENLGSHPSCFKNGSFQLTLCTVTDNGRGKYFPICR